MEQNLHHLRLSFAHYTYLNCQRLILLADAKAGACFAISGTILPFVLDKVGEIKTLLSHGGPFQKITLISLLSLSLLSMFFCLLCAFSVFAPRINLKKSHTGHIFFTDINRYQGDNLKFYEGISVLKLNDFLEDYSSQITTLSKILEKKYRLVSYSIRLTGLALVFWFLLFSLLAFMKGATS